MNNKASTTQRSGGRVWQIRGAAGTKPQRQKARLVLKLGRFEDDRWGRACEQRSLGIYPKPLEGCKQNDPSYIFESLLGVAWRMNWGGACVEAARPIDDHRHPSEK